MKHNICGSEKLITWTHHGVFLSDPRNSPCTTVLNYRHCVSYQNASLMLLMPLELIFPTHIYCVSYQNVCLVWVCAKFLCLTMTRLYSFTYLTGSAKNHWHNFGDPQNSDLKGKKPKCIWYAPQNMFACLCLAQKIGLELFFFFSHILSWLGMIMLFVNGLNGYTVWTLLVLLRSVSWKVEHSSRKNLEWNLFSLHWCYENISLE